MTLIHFHAPLPENSRRLWICRRAWSATGLLRRRTCHCPGWSGSTWPASPGTADKTTWTYHEASGLLTAKTDNAGKSVTYTYGTDGKLATRTWSRANGTNTLVTTYSYSSAGDLTGIDYSDSTPDVSFTYDRLGRQITADSSVSAHTFAYDGLQLDTETIILAGITNVLDRSHDTFGRATGFTLGADYSVGYGYDTYGRFSSVSSSVPSVSSVVQYSYLPSSDLLSGYSDSASGLTVSRTYEENRNLLTQVKNSVDSTTLSQYDYGNDAGGRRTSVKHSGTAFDVGPAFNAYGYNARSEVTSAARYWGADLGDTGEPVDGQAYAYAYDNIGNRTSSSRGTNAMTYTANGLNQYTQRTIPDGIDVLGSAETNTTVTVNNLATTRFGKYWYRALTGTNSSAADYHSVNVVGVYNPPGTNDPDIVTSATGHVFVAQTPEAFTYDDDGNLLSDGRFSYTWDAENRLLSAETMTNLPASVPRKKVEFAYDYMSRRAGKTVSSWDSGTTNWSEISDSSFLYDSWNLVSELSTVNGSLFTNSYVRGLDLSGSLSGAGGIGGLLAATIGTNSVCYTYDGNGNVSELISTNGAIAAHYEYSPFGETVVATGPLAKANLFRFSTKYTDDEIAMLYYGYRFYSPSVGRWASRDPIEEDGGENLSGWSCNDGVNTLDILGLKVCYRWMFITFYTGQKEQGNELGDPLEKTLNEWDAADANRRYTPNGTGKPDFDPNASPNEPYRTRPYIDKKWSPGYKIRIRRGKKGIDTRTVNDSGSGWALPRPGLPNGVDPDEWLDLWMKTRDKANALGEEWDIAEIDVGDDCPCPKEWSTVNPPPEPENMKKYKEATKDR